jgi:hypothetical protein
VQIVSVFRLFFVESDSEIFLEIGHDGMDFASMFRAMTSPFLFFLLASQNK